MDATGRTLWPRIEARLRALGRSAQGACHRAGLDKDFARNIKRGKSLDPGNERLRRFAERGLDWSLEELLGSNPPVRLSPPRDPGEQELLSIYIALPPAQRADFLGIARLLGRLVAGDSPRRRTGGAKRGLG